MASEAQERILSCPDLPSLPGAAVRILELTQETDVSLRDIARVVEQDPGLAGRILNTVNSSFYGLAQPCGTVDGALNYLGLTTIKSLVLGFSLVDSTRAVGTDTAFSLARYWSRTIHTATAARLLALKFRQADPDEAFTAALFQDIGILVAVSALGQEYLDAVGEHLQNPNLPEIEEEALGFTHTDLGSAIARKWRLPHTYAAVIQHHHHHDRAPVSAEQVVRTAVLGSVSADILSGGAEAGSSLTMFQRLAGEWYAESAGNIDQQIHDLASSAKELGKLFEQQIESPPVTGLPPSSARRPAAEIRPALQHECPLENLKGISGRDCFDQRSEALFDEAREANASIALLFCDGDRFRAINSTLGHKAGDAVLVELARRIRNIVKEAGEVFRYAGAEFAVVLPGYDFERATQLAETIRAAVAEVPIDLSALNRPGLPQTVSIGVAAGTPGSSHALASIGALARAAQEAVDRAKENGRNQVERAAIPPAVAAVPRPDPVPPPKPAPAAKPSKGVGKSARVLIVEDDPLAATLWRTMLLKNNGVEVALATGRRGVEKLLASGYVPSVVVSDFMLGSGTAVDVVLIVRRALGDDIPILVISAQLDREREEAAMAAGATACVSKTELCKKFKWWIDRVIAGDLGEKRAAG